MIETEHVHDERQAAAIDLTYGEFVVIAGPGTGKTHVATERIKRLIEKGEDPDTVIAVTFTTRAAQQLEQRVGYRLGFCGTIHALARFVLELLGPGSGLQTGFSVWDETDKRAVIEDIIGTYRLNATVRAVEEFLRPNHDTTTAASWQVADVAKRYGQRKDAMNAEDFDGLLARALKRLIAHPLALEEMRKRWKHLVVDEVQDVDPVQALLLHTLRPNAGPADGTSRFVIGDPCQSIYGFRGADPEILRMALRDTERSVQIVQNYRSRDAIVKVLNEIAIDIHVGREAQCTDLPGGIVSFRQYDTDDEEAESIAHELIEHEGSYSKTAVLARQNRTLELLVPWLDYHGVPYKFAGQRRLRFRTDLPRMLINAIRVALNPADDFAFEQAAEWFVAPSPDDWERFKRASVGMPLSGQAPHFTDSHGSDRRERMDHLALLIDDLHDHRHTEVAWLARLEDFLTLVESRRYASQQSALWLRDQLRLFRHLQQERGSTGLLDALSWMVMEQGADEVNDDREAVTLSTIHLAKGLEFDTVYLPGLNDGVLPSAQSLRAHARDDMEPIREEFRIFFVAVSRASSRLFASAHGIGAFNHSYPVSRFVRYLG
jgi:DNA helicase-2/ATP-dependent DNA helicase PcrA